MLFNSIHFAVFFPLVFVAYWLIEKKTLLQNFFLLVASYYFYGSWDYRFLALLIFSTLVGYFTGIKIGRAGTLRQKKLWLWTNISMSLGLLAVFKYYNFFVSSFSVLLSTAGFAPNDWSLNILLPLGISFYTLHGLSYQFDVYHGKIKPVTSLIDYSVFVGFFPLLVAGPIERAWHLLPQIQRPRSFDYDKTVDGLRQVLWGLFKKIVIADNCAVHVNTIFENPDLFSSSTLAWGAVLFSFQIYGDFSGYSDIATGTARMLGFDLLKNFAFPYFSRDMGEFWRRWHISLNSWLRDYLYIPLGGSKGQRWKVVRNIFIIFLVSGLWHGANWTFLAWGFIHATFFVLLLLTGKHRKHLGIVAEGRFWPNLTETGQIAATFFIATFARIFFRAPTMDQAFTYIENLFSTSLFTLPTRGLSVVPFILFMVGTEWLHRDKEHGLQIGRMKLRAARWSLYILMILIIFTFGASQQRFIYFQF